MQSRGFLASPSPSRSFFITTWSFQEALVFPRLILTGLGIINSPLMEA